MDIHPFTNHDIAKARAAASSNCHRVTRGFLEMTKTFLLIAAVVTALAVQGAAAAPAKTPDQQLVAGLEQARSAARATLGGKPSLRKVVAGLRSARMAAPRAVGALEIPTMRLVLRQGAALARRSELRRLIALTSAALGDFGVPLEKDFASFVVARTYPWIPEFHNFSGLSATVEEDVTEVVIGAADRTTANAGEAGFAPVASSPLAINRVSLAVFSDVIGRFTSGWCELESGLITCRMRPAMPAELVFSIAFAPRQPKGTKLLVKFRTASGDRSYAIFATR